MGEKKPPDGDPADGENELSAREHLLCVFYQKAADLFKP